jgi:putative flippase GtrA
VKFVLSYTIFALFATAANIGSQDIFLRIYNGNFDITISVMIGTGVGLLVKYILDKKFIFRYQVTNVVHDTQTFSLYTLMGVVTTAIFWSFEFSFEYLFQTKEMRYFGGIIGLCLGYWMKYHLDKRFVFTQREI